jgi:hypothetical protein
MGLDDQQLIERWWVYGLVVAMAISVADSFFAIRRAQIDEIGKKRKDECNTHIFTRIKFCQHRSAYKMHIKLQCI